MYPPRKPRPAGPHEHVLPNGQAFTNPRLFPAGTALRCAGCKQWLWVKTDLLIGGKPRHQWKPVRWWNWRIMDRIVAYEREQRLRPKTRSGKSA